MPSSTWNLTGNSGNPSSAFLGTADGAPVVIKTAGADRIHVAPGGNVGVNNPNPAAALHVSALPGNPPAIQADAGPGFGLQVSSAQSIAVRAIATADTAVFATSSAGMGVDARSDKSIALRAIATADTAVFATSSAGMGVDARSDSNVGLGAHSTSGIAVNAASDKSIAVRAIATSDTGVFATSASGRGVDARSDSGIGLFASGGDVAGFFQGNVKVTGDVNVGGDVILAGADCAEQFDLAPGLAAAEPGSVLVVGPAGALTECTRAYDRCVVGVVSGAGAYRPALILDRRGGTEARAAIALVGKVSCKVDADLGSIAVGDLLTSSATPGHAMRASDPARAFGATIGKALAPLERGRGLVPILVALQ